MLSDKSVIVMEFGRSRLSYPNSFTEKQKKQLELKQSAAHVIRRPLGAAQ